MNRIVAGLVVVTAVIALAGCGAKEGGSNGSAAAKPAASGSKYDSGPRAAESAVNEDLAEQGEKLFQLKGCSACHTFGKKMSGPDLAGVTMRRTAEWMVASHGKDEAAARVRAATGFYDEDPERQAYWRDVLEQIDRLPSQ